MTGRHGQGAIGQANRSIVRIDWQDHRIFRIIPPLSNCPARVTGLLVRESHSALLVS